MSSVPWDDPEAIDWVQNSDSFRKFCRLVEGTLQLDTKKHVHEIRAAASLVIMLCRKNLWSTKSQTDEHIVEELDRVTSLAVRQLVKIKQIFELNARSKPGMQSNKTYRNLLVSLDQEIRILEARMTDPKPNIPEQPPSTWGKFWV